MADVIYSAPSSRTASDYEAVRQSSAVWEALRQQQLQSEMLETQAREAETQRKLKEAIMDKLMGYGTPAERSAELYQPLPQGAVSQALQRGGVLSNIAPGGQYYTTPGTGGGTQVQSRLGVMADMPKQNVLSELERKTIGLPAESTQDKQMREIAKMLLQESIRHGYAKEREETRKTGRMEELYEKEKLIRGRPPKAQRYKYELEDEILRTIASGQSLSPALQAARKQMDPHRKSTMDLALDMVKSSNAYMMETDSLARYGMLKQQIDAIERMSGMDEETTAEMEQDFIDNLPSAKEYYKAKKGDPLVSPYTGKKYTSDGKGWSESK